MKRGSALRRRPGTPSGDAVLPPGVEWSLAPPSQELFDWLREQLGPEWDFMRTLVLPDPDHPRGTRPRDPGESLAEFLAAERAAIADGSGTYPTRGEQQ